jgi:hypothetical protein
MWTLYRNQQPVNSSEFYHFGRNKETNSLFSQIRCYHLQQNKARLRTGWQIIPTMFAVSETRRVFLWRYHSFVEQNPSGLVSTEKLKVQS